MIKELEYPIAWNDNWAIVDSTKLTASMSCPRQYFYEYVLGWRSTVPNNHLIFGSAWHVAMEHLCLNGYDKTEDAGLLFMDSYRKELPQDTDTLYSPKTPTAATEALQAYVDYYREDEHKYEVLYTEIAGSAMITATDIMYFRMDTILREKNSGKYITRDFKTSKRKGRTWTDQWALATASGLYTHVLYCLYPEDEVKGFTARGTFFYKSKAAEFEDVPCWMSKNQMQVWLWNTCQWYDMLKWNFESLSKCKESDEVMMAFPMQGKSCTNYFGCAYHDFCTAWPNPLRRCQEPPLGFEVDFWNPMEMESSHQMTV